MIKDGRFPNRPPADWRPPLLESARTHAKLIQCVNGNSETETELQAAERRISKIQRCGAARVASMEQSFLGLLEAIGEDPSAGRVWLEHRARSALHLNFDRWLQADLGWNKSTMRSSSRSQRNHSRQNIELYSLCEHH